jgi:hypothetical protein
MNTAITRAASTLAISIAPSVLALASIILQNDRPPIGYSKVKITNLTNWWANGEVNYASLFCRNDKFSGLKPGDTWTGPDRRWCLITWISASLSGGGPSVTRYDSSGTGFSEFFITPSGSGYQVFSSHEDPTTNRAQPELATRPFLNIAHMVNTDDAVDWALSQGANGLEMDMQFNSDGAPSEFRHGVFCDCSCSRDGEHVCDHLDGYCSASAPVAGHLRHIASKSLQVAAIIIDSKVDDLSKAAQAAAGAAVVQALSQELFPKGYKGFVVVSAPKWDYSAYLLAAAAQANQSPYYRQIYVGVDQDTPFRQSIDPDKSNTLGARIALDHLWRDVGSPPARVVYGSGISSCVNGSFVGGGPFYAETMLAGWYEAARRVRLVDIWTLDDASDMRKYIFLGVSGIITNKPGVLAKVVKDQGMTLAQPGKYLP